MAGGEWLEDDSVFREYILEDIEYYNGVVEILGSGEELPSSYEKLDTNLVQAILIGDGFWIEPLIYWADQDHWKGVYSKYFLLLSEASIRTTWFRKAADLGEVELEVPEYSRPSDIGIEERNAGIMENANFERFMQAFSILNLEWLLYVHSQTEYDLDRDMVEEVIEEAANFFSTGEIENPELFRLQIQQHRMAAEWLENFIELTETNSITLDRTLNGIRNYADKMEKRLEGDF